MIGFEKYIDYDPELEAAVLGVLLLEPAAYGSVFTMLIPESFYTIGHDTAFKGIQEAFTAGLPIDLVTVTRKLYDGGIKEINGENTGYFLTQLVSNISNSSHLEPWCIMLRELAVHRELLLITRNGLKDGDTLDNVTDIERRLKRVLDVRVSDDWMHISQVGLKVDKIISNPQEHSKSITTGIAAFDRMNKGWKAGNFIIEAARPAMGKSALMAMQAVAAAREGKIVGVIGLEMPNEDTLMRMVSSNSKVELRSFDNGDLLTEDKERDRVYKSLSELSTLNIYFSDKAQVNIHDIRAKADKLRRKHGVDILFIDYIQLVEAEKSKQDNREQEVSKISRGLKILAMTLQIPVIALAQLNRAADGKEPELNNLRESGSLEQDADVVIFIHRPDDNGSLSLRADILAKKWRNGSPLRTTLNFEPETVRFYEDETFIAPPADNPFKGFQNARQPYNDKQPFD